MPVELRSPAAELQQQYRDAGLWLDRGFGEYLAELLMRAASTEVRIWSTAAPAHTTFREVDAAARRLATGLQRRGIGPGDVVTYQLPNCIEALISLYGIAMAGAVVVPVVHFYGPKELGFILGQLASRLHITAASSGSVDHLDGLESVRPRLDALEHVVVVGSASRAWTTPFAALVDEAPLGAIPRVDPMTPAVIGYTSGTTADPKGVVHTSNSYLGEVEQLARYDVAASRPLLTGAPLAHAIGMTSGAVLPLVRRHAAHIIDRWDPARVLDIIDAEGLTSGSGSPFFLTSLLDAPAFSSRHAALIERAGLGGAPVPNALGDRAEQLGIAVLRSYGSTEHPTATGSARHDTAAHRKYTDGCALDGCDVRIVDDGGRDVGVGEVGEILTRGPDLFFGYTDERLTDAAIDADGWYHTDDLGSIDTDGYLTVTDRKKDIIIRGGENISAAEVEEVLIRMEGVSQVAVVAAPDPRFGEHACAFYTLAPGAPPLSMDTVRAHFAAAGLARQKWPEELRPVQELPRTPSGKVKKHVLRDTLRATAAP